jgi:uncharacterized protein with von Willebrand factor type A (vWA) domain
VNSSADGNDKFVMVALMKGELADATIKALQEAKSNITLEDCETFWRVSAPREIQVDFEQIGDELGRDLPMHEWLGIMSTYAGRIQMETNRLVVTSDMLQLEPSNH